MNGRRKGYLRKPIRKDSVKVRENSKWESCLDLFFPMIVEVEIHLGKLMSNSGNIGGVKRERRWGVWFGVSGKWDT